MPSKPKKYSASIIIPAYNAQEVIQTCLRALQEQTLSPTEIIVVDDGSTDKTASVVRSFSKVKIISQINKGPATARNAGAKAAKGEIIVFIDSDCEPEKNWLEEMLQPFADEKVVGVQGAYKTKQKEWVAQFDQADIEYRYEHMKKAKKLDWVGSYSAAYRREIFLQEKGFDETFPKASGEDAELSYRLADKGMKLVFAPNAIVYHIHPATVERYLEVKYSRAYWRTRMYWKHPGKGTADSYTPNSIKITFFVGALFLLFIVGLILQPFFLVEGQSLIRAEAENVLFIMLIFLLQPIITFWNFIPRLFRAGVLFGFFGVVLIWTRTLSFVLGAAFGLIDWRTWK